MRMRDGPGRASLCCVLKMIFEQMASPKASSLIPGLHQMQDGAILPHLKILCIHCRLNCCCECRQWRRWHHLTDHGYSASRLCTRPFCTTKLQRRPCSTICSFWERVDALCLQTFLVITDKRGRSIWVDSLQAGPYGWLHYFCQVFTTLVFWNNLVFELQLPSFETIWFLSCNT